VVASRARVSVEVCDSVHRARGWWAMCLRSTVACSRLGTRRRRAPRPGSRWRHPPRPGMMQQRALRSVSKMAGGGGMLMSRATEEREHLAVLKNC
jgi:hypothetical protein